MSAFMGSIGYYVTHPQAIIYVIATALLYPVLFAMLLSFIYVVVEFGRFTWEVMVGFRGRRIVNIESAAKAAKEEIAAGKPGDAMRRLAGLRCGRYFTDYFKALGDGTDLTRRALLKHLADTELRITRTLEHTRVFIRFGPILGLMGTLIPISPALVALAKGDISTLSSNLVVAFSVTVIGLLVGGLGYLMSTVRDRRYAQDISDVEYALEIMEL
jgi:biopolymer transport protein ExbB/TolQ